jgi:hypothetical protein
MAVVLPSLRALALSRIAAALVAVALSGALQPAAASNGGAASASRSSCCGSRDAKRAGGCPHCHRVRGGDGLPPCHRAAAREQRARHGDGGGERGPCVKGSCGQPEAPQAPGTRVVESYTLPVVPAAVRCEVSEDVPPARAVPCGAAAFPETPPPRAA